MATIKLVTLNVEFNRHWNEIIPFLEQESPDVVCLQELFEQDAKMLADRFGYMYVYIPVSKRIYDPANPSVLVAEGSALLTRLSLKNINSAYYYQAAPDIQLASMEQKRGTISQGVVWGTIEKDETEFTIASTHFTWTPDGQPNPNQDQDIQALLKILSAIPDLILCGDLNTPRGQNRIYQAFIERFKDNIPSDVKTTIDITNHRAAKNPVERKKLETLVVDYIFSTPEYSVENVQCRFGLSDHCAIISNVTRNN